MNRRMFLSLLPAIPLVPSLLGDDDPWALQQGDPRWREMIRREFPPSGVTYHKVYCDGNKWHLGRPDYVVFDDLDDLIEVK